MAADPNSSDNSDGGGSAGGDSAAQEPSKLYYRFRVKTADGRELTSSVAEVDLSADTGGESEPAAGTDSSTEPVSQTTQTA